MFYSSRRKIVLGLTLLSISSCGKNNKNLEYSLSMDTKIKNPVSLKDQSSQSSIENKVDRSVKQNKNGNFETGINGYVPVNQIGIGDQSSLSFGFSDGYQTITLSHYLSIKPNQTGFYDFSLTLLIPKTHALPTDYSLNTECTFDSSNKKCQIQSLLFVEKDSLGNITQHFSDDNKNFMKSCNIVSNLTGIDSARLTESTTTLSDGTIESQSKEMSFSNDIVQEGVRSAFTTIDCENSIGQKVYSFSMKHKITELK